MFSKECERDQNKDNRSDEGETQSPGIDQDQCVSHWHLIGSNVTGGKG